MPTNTKVKSAAFLFKFDDSQGGSRCVAYGFGSFAVKIEGALDHASRSDRYNYECIFFARGCYSL